jgi:hypothetical protein
MTRCRRLVVTVVPVSEIIADPTRPTRRCGTCRRYLVPRSWQRAVTGRRITWTHLKETHRVHVTAAD